MSSSLFRQHPGEVQRTLRSSACHFKIPSGSRVETEGLGEELPLKINPEKPNLNIENVLGVSLTVAIRFEKK